MCVRVFAKTAYCAHTHTHTDTGGVQTHRWERAVSSHSPGSVIEAASLKKFELFLNFSSKSAIYMGKRELGRRFLLFLFVLFFLVLFLLLEERRCPQPLLLLLGAER